MSSPHTKLSEAAFFLELFEATQERSESLTHENDLQTEASFLFSAILNAFYAALDQWHRRNKKKALYDAFKREHPEIHGSTESGGWRNTTVHLEHIPISHVGNVPPKGCEVHLVFGDSPKLAPPESESTTGNVVLTFTPKYYVAYRGELKEVVSFCRAHYAGLHKLITENSSLFVKSQG